MEERLNHIGLLVPENEQQHDGQHGDREQIPNPAPDLILRVHPAPPLVVAPEQVCDDEREHHPYPDRSPDPPLARHHILALAKTWVDQTAAVPAVPVEARPSTTPLTSPLVAAKPVREPTVAEKPLLTPFTPVKVGMTRNGTVK